MNYNGEERRNTMFDKDFYDKMMEVHTDLKYMKTWTETHDANDKEVHKSLNIRVKVLEDDRLKVIGVAGFLGVITAFLTSLFHK